MSTSSFSSSICCLASCSTCDQPLVLALGVRELLAGQLVAAAQGLVLREQAVEAPAELRRVRAEQADRVLEVLEFLAGLTGWLFHRVCVSRSVTARIAIGRRDAPHHVPHESLPAATGPRESNSLMPSPRSPARDRQVERFDADMQDAKAMPRPWIWRGSVSSGNIAPRREFEIRITASRRTRRAQRARMRAPTALPPGRSRTPRKLPVSALFVAHERHPCRRSAATAGFGSGPCSSSENVRPIPGAQEARGRFFAALREEKTHNLSEFRDLFGVQPSISQGPWVVKRIPRAQPVTVTP